MKFAELADYLTRNDRVRVIVFQGPEERTDFVAATAFPTNNNLL
jgi:hypothetical protein